MSRTRFLFIIGVILWFSTLNFIVADSLASDHLSKSSGQTVYAPVYSHVLVGAQGQEFRLATTLSVRNTNLDKHINIESVGYHDSTGKLIRQLVKSPVIIGPLASSQYFIGEGDTSGGFSAFFLVKWSSENRVNEPIVEVVNVGTRSGQGISFVSTGKVID